MSRKRQVRRRVLSMAMLCLAAAAGPAQSPASMASKPPASGEQVFDGFVTSVASPSEFKMGQTTFHLSGKTVCGDLEVHTVLLGGTKEKRKPCAEIAIKVGDLDRIWVAKQSDGSYQANKMLRWDLSGHLYNRDESVLGDRLAGGAILEELPEPPSAGGTQRVWIAGVPVVIDSQTRFSYAASQKESKLGLFPFAMGGSAPLGGSKFRQESASVIASQLVPGMYVAYQAGLQDDGKISTRKVLIMPGSVVAAEKPISPAKVVEPNYSEGVDGELDLPYGPPVDVPADKFSQSHVQKLGDKLIAELRASHALDQQRAKDVRFYVVRSFSYDRRNTLVRLEGLVSQGFTASYRTPDPPDGTVVDWVTVTADGIVLVPEPALLKLTNDAQLFFLLSTAVSSYIQHERALAEELLHFATAKWSSGPDVGPDYEAPEELREMRMGMRLTYNAHMNFCEAPYAWSGSAYTNPQPTTLPPQQRPHPWYMEYAFSLIKTFYPKVDCGSLETGTESYATFLQHLRQTIGQRPLETPRP